jgi:hypothetical protein
VKPFEPYDRIQDPYPEAYDGLKALIQKSLGERRPAYIFVNNRLELPLNPPRAVYSHSASEGSASRLISPKALDDSIRVHPGL